MESDLITFHFVHQCMYVCMYVMQNNSGNINSDICALSGGFSVADCRQKQTENERR